MMSCQQPHYGVAARRRDYLVFCGRIQPSPVADQRSEVTFTKWGIELKRVLDDVGLVPAKQTPIGVLYNIWPPVSKPRTLKCGVAAATHTSATPPSGGQLS
ncbi:hypothetical protein J6590_054839 [Homalodisca vitripennis]|nr:hypothetical protein J6590_054839 [Homalodisca vitripennis]